MTATAMERQDGPRRAAVPLRPDRALRGNCDLALLFGGQVVSAIGDWLHVTTLVALVYTLTGSAVVAGAPRALSARATVAQDTPKRSICRASR